jgi:hypothetical protein
MGNEKDERMGHGGWGANSDGFPYISTNLQRDITSGIFLDELLDGPGAADREGPIEGFVQRNLVTG